MTGVLRCNDGMRSPARLRLEPRPSRMLRGAMFAVCGATAGLAAWLPLPPLLRLALVLAVAWVTLREWRAALGRGLPAIVHLGADRRLVVTGRDGRSVDGVISAESWVGSWLTTLVWRADAPGRRIPARSRAMLILPDMLEPDDFRQLRVLLRYGRAAGAAPAASTRGQSAGRPASQALPS